MLLALTSLVFADPLASPCSGVDPHKGKTSLEQVCPNTDPPRPRGIYVLAPWGADKRPKPGAIKQPFVDGITVRIFWKDLEPQPGQYDWTVLDDYFRLTREAGKKMRLAIAGGVYSPEWMLTESGATGTACSPELKALATGGLIRTAKGSSSVQLMCAPVEQGPFKEDGEHGHWYPTPWDPQYRAAWGTFLEAMLAHMDDNGQLEDLTWIAVTGPNSHNGEVSHPRDAPWERLRAPTGKKVGSRGAKLGKVLNAVWREELERFDELFGSRGIHYTVSLVYKSFSPRGNSTQDWEFKNNLLKAGVSMRNGQFFGVQTNGLDDRASWAQCNGIEKKFEEGGAKRHWRLVAQHGCTSRAARGLTGFQVRAGKNLYEADDSPCGRARSWKMLHSNIRALEVDFVEIYGADATYEDVDASCDSDSMRAWLNRTHNWLTGDSLADDAGAPVRVSVEEKVLVDDATKSIVTEILYDDSTKDTKTVPFSDIEAIEVFLIEQEEAYGVRARLKSGKKRLLLKEKTDPSTKARVYAAMIGVEVVDLTQTP